MRTLIVLVLLSTALRGQVTGPVSSSQRVSSLVADKSVVVADLSTLSPELLTNGALTSGTSWSATGDGSLSGGQFAYAHSTGAATLTQAGGSLAVALKPSRWYKLTYSIVRVSIGGLRGQISATIGDTTASSLSLEMNVGTGRVLYFKTVSTATGSDFALSFASSTGTGRFALDDLSLKEVVGGNVEASGKFTGGGSKGIAIDGEGNAVFDGNVTIGTTVPEGSKAGTVAAGGAAFANGERLQPVRPRVNYLLSSNTFSNSSVWAVGAGSVTVTANYGRGPTTPDGLSLGPSSLISLASNSSLVQTVAFPEGATFSVYIKGPGDHHVNLNGAGTTGGGPTNPGFTGGWERRWFTNTGSAGTTVSISSFSAGANDLEVCCAQLEPGPMAATGPGEYVETTDTAIKEPSPTVTFPPVLETLPSNGLAQTPPMGFDTWNAWHTDISDALVRQLADTMVSSGMKDAGYQYLIIDAGWNTTARDADGNMVVDTAKFPSGIKAVADYVHGKGLKFGIYSSPGRIDCSNNTGSFGHEYQDAAQWASWGVDALKYDWCSGGTDFALWLNQYGDAASRAVFQQMGKALQAAGRPILYYVQPVGTYTTSMHMAQAWGAAAGGNMINTMSDLLGTWGNDSSFLFADPPYQSTNVAYTQGLDTVRKYAGPGRWNSMDMLRVGGYTDTENQTIFSLYAIKAAPLIATNDIRSMTETTKGILTNSDVIAVSQDALGKQGLQVSSTACGSSTCEAWAKQLTSGCAIALYNRDSAAQDVTVSFATLATKIPACGSGPFTTTRDLYGHASMGTLTTGYTASQIPAHGSVMFTVAP